MDSPDSIPCYLEKLRNGSDIFIAGSIRDEGRQTYFHYREGEGNLNYVLQGWLLSLNFKCLSQT